ncbi:MAG: hypothetical protein DME27_07605 [Verrucomicrobia bacterium]|nr:MAG: hypothetical protein DME27_07605 [Verrucomicrobiota bacterium]
MLAGKVRDGAGAIASTRGACAPQIRSPRHAVVRHTHSCVTDVARGYRGIPELTIFLETAR